MDKGKKILLICMAALFLYGLGIFLYPMVSGRLVDNRVQERAEAFFELVDTLDVPDKSDSAGPELVESSAEIYPDLLAAMKAYNEKIYLEEQAGLCDPWSYQQPSFDLSEFNVPEDVIGVLSIPALDAEFPIYLGATSENMEKGVVHLSQTSLPIGGINTNTVLAGHRGWNGADFLRYIEKLQVGDRVTVRNLWGELVYEAVEIRIIEPNEVEQILIQEGKDLLTILTCHPYASGGKQRYVVYCERVMDE